jgi:hypothetical protein
MTSMFRSTPSSLQQTLGDLYRFQNDHDFSARFDRKRHPVAIASWHRALHIRRSTGVVGLASSAVYHNFYESRHPSIKVIAKPLQDVGFDRSEPNCVDIDPRIRAIVCKIVETQQTRTKRRMNRAQRPRGKPCVARRAWNRDRILL